MIGVVSISEAMVRGRESGLDLVEISPTAEPPVCRLMDYGKFKYEESRKERMSRKRQHAAELKEIKFHANVGDHDYSTKTSHIRGFLEKGHKVKASLYFRGRENAHRELGFAIINRVLKDCDDICHVDMMPKLIGNSIVAILGPRVGGKHAAVAPARVPAPTAAPPVPPPPAAAPVNPVIPAAAPLVNPVLPPAEESAGRAATETL